MAQTRKEWKEISFDMSGAQRLGGPLGRGEAMSQALLGEGWQRSERHKGSRCVAGRGRKIATAGSSKLRAGLPMRARGRGPASRAQELRGRGAAAGSPLLMAVTYHGA